MSAPAVLLALLLGPRGALADEERPVLAPDPRGRAAPDRNFDLETLRLDLELLPEERAVRGTAELVVRRLFEGPLVLHQVDLDIASVAVDGEELARWTRGEQLFVDLGEREAATVSITWRATPRTGLHFREAGRGLPDAYDEVWSQGEGEDHRHWFPSWDYPNDRFVYEGSVRGPEGWTVLTNSGLDVVNYLVMVAAAPYDVHAHPAAPDISVLVPPGTSRAAVDRVLLPVADMRTWMGERAGVAYPWGPYRQVFVQRFLYGGMENTSATINADRLLGGPRVWETRPWDVSTVAHELAHQWYGDLLTCDGWRELWLNEGFASFVASAWMAEALPEEWFPGRDPAATAAASVRYWRSRALGEHALAGRFHQGPSPSANAKVYVKGAMVLHMLRVMLGEERFWAGIRRYTTEHQLALVDTHDLQEAMEAVSGRELDWFFQQWTELARTPELRVESAYDGEELVVTVRQDPDRGPPFTLPVTVSVGTAAGESLRLEGWLDDAELELRTPLEAPPRYVAFDPDGGLLAEVSQRQEPEAWAAQLEAPEALARLVAIDSLAETDLSEPLARLLADEAVDPLTRSVAAEALGKQRSAEALVAGLDARHGYVREAAAEALAGAPGDGVAEALTRAVLRDPNPDVQARALLSLARHEPARALQLARRLTASSGHDEDKRAAAALDVMGDHGVPADLGALLAEGRPRRLGSHGLAAAGRLVLRQEDATRRERLAERVTRVAADHLEDLDLRVRQRALSVLESAGTKEAVPALERFLREERVESLRGDARAALKAIRARKEAPPPRPNELEARLQALEERLAELEEEREAWLQGR